LIPILSFDAVSVMNIVHAISEQELN
jgi:hypothetical protein